MKKLFCLLSCMVILSCGGRVKQVVSASEKLYVDDLKMTEIVLTNENVLNKRDAIHKIEIIPLESPNRIMTGRIDGVVVTDENIIIYDKYSAHNAFIFDRNGKYLAIINRQGRGPQEYLKLDHLALLPDQKTIAINDSHGGKILYFSLDGKFISSTPSNFWFMGMEYVDENNVVCASYGMSESDPGLETQKNRTNLLWFADNNFNVKGGILPTRYKNRISLVPTIKKFDDKVIIHRPYSDTLYRATPQGLDALYRVEMGEINGFANLAPNITQEEVNAIGTQKSRLTGFFADGENYLNLAVSRPPNGKWQEYLFSKHTGKVYALDNDADSIFALPAVPSAAVGDVFVDVIQAHIVIEILGEKILKQHPKLAGLTEESNPVVILYKFKDEL